LQMAGLGRLGVALPTASRVLGIAYFAGLFAVFRRAAALPFAWLVLATLPGLSVWAMGGLETVSFAFWLVLGAWLTQKIVEGKETFARAGVLAGVALSAAALTRPEGLGVGLVALAWVATARRWGALRRMACALVAPVLAWEIFRVAYYGDVIANSARAKLGDYPLARSVLGGVEYLAASSPSWVYGDTAALVVLALTRRIASVWMLAMALPVLAALLLEGGDHMVGTRLFVPIATLVVFTAGVHGARAQGTRWRRGAAAAILTAAAALQAPIALARDREPD